MPPSRPPDTRDLVTRRQRALASADASRYDLTNRVFNAALPYFRPQSRMPLVYWRSRTPDRNIDVQADPFGAIAMAGSKYEPEQFSHRVGQIAYPVQLDRFGREPPWRSDPKIVRQHFIDILLHELAHTQQNPTTIEYLRQPGSPHLKLEGGADAFAALARDVVMRRMGLGNRAYMPFSSGYGNLGQQYIRKYGPNQALYGQFGRRGRRFVPFLTGSQHGTFSEWGTRR